MSDTAAVVARAVPLRPMPPSCTPDSRVRSLLVELRAEASRADRDGDGASADALRTAAAALASRHSAVTLLTVPVQDSLASATCFGTFSLSVVGRPLALSGLRPRARSTLRLLALHAGQPVHREVLLASLWPEADATSASRSLLTTLSSLRTALRDSGVDGALQREGSAYLLSAQAVITDLTLAHRALARARRCRDTAPEDADAAYVHALDLYAGEVLAEEGPAEWVSGPREQWRARMSTAAHELAELRYRRGQLTEAVAAARRGLTLDRWSDPLWRVLIAALRAGEDDISARRAENDYAALLSDLAG